MAIWIPYKAKPHEKNKRLYETPAKPCRICGKSTYNSSTICESCGDFLGQMRSRERKKKK